MSRRLSLRRRLSTPVLLALLALAPVWAAGCGGAGSTTEQGTLRVSYAVFPDYLDPALASSLEALTALQNTYVPLLTYAHAGGMAGTRLIPGLARSLPRITNGGRRYTLFLRPHLEYSDGTPVRASDFKFAVERLLRLSSVGSPFYTDIVGAERFASSKRGGIPGIRSDDHSGRIVIDLVAPRGTFSYELGLLYAAPLPPGTPISDQTAGPPPATGPYVITKVVPGRRWQYARNPVWKPVNSQAMPDLPSGHVPAIDVSVVKNASTQVDDVEAGRTDLMKNPPPPDRYAEVKRRFEGTQFRSDRVISNFYFWMNTERAPFNDVLVRRAVNYALAPAALQRIYAGTLEPLQQVLPPAMPGHRHFELYPHDLERAKALMRRADPADRKVSVWTNNAPPNREAGEYYAGVLEELGLHAKLKAIDPADYFVVIGNASTPDLDTGWGSWLLDYPHPNDYFQPQLSGESIAPTGNTNWARFSDPAISARIRRLGHGPLGPRQISAYAALDREVMSQAPWAPFGTLTLGTFVSSAIDLGKVVVSPIFGQDLTSFEFK